MKLLLDTCAFIWLSTAPRKLASGMRALYENPDNEVFLSVVSTWEIAIKHRSGKLRLPNDMTPADFIPEARRRHGIDVLPVREEDSQAIANQMIILTPDPLITQYPVLTRW